MNLNEGLPLDDQVKMDPDSTTLSPSLLKGMSPMQWPNGIKKENMSSDCDKQQVLSSRRVSETIPNKVKIKEEVPNYYQHCNMNVPCPNSDPIKVLNSTATTHLNFHLLNESNKHSIGSNHPPVKSTGITSPQHFKTDLSAMADRLKTVNDSHLHRRDDFKTPPIPKPKSFLQNDHTTAKQEKRNPGESPVPDQLSQQQKKSESSRSNGIDSPGYPNFQSHIGPSFVNFTSHAYRMTDPYQNTNYLNQPSLQSHLNTSYGKNDQSKMFYNQMDLNKSVNQPAHFYPHSQVSFSRNSGFFEKLLK